MQCAGLEAKEILPLEIECQAVSTSRIIHYLGIHYFEFQTILWVGEERTAHIHKNI